MPLESKFLAKLWPRAKNTTSKKENSKKHKLAVKSARLKSTQTHRHIELGAADGGGGE